MTERISPKDPLWGTMYALFAPLIVWPGYEDSSKKWANDAQMARFKKILSNDKSERATDAEVAIYLSTASLVAPMTTPDWAQVYFRAASKAFPAIHDFMVRDDDKYFAESLKEPNAEQKKLHDELAKWIYEKQKEALLKKYKGKDSSESARKDENHIADILQPILPLQKPKQLQVPLSKKEIPSPPAIIANNEEAKKTEKELGLQWFAKKRSARRKKLRA